jgi:copper chaperone
MDTINLNIEGMHCGGCATGIQMVTEQLDGVTSAFVDLDGKKGTWEIDSSVVSADKIIEEIVKLGYKATVA